MLVAGDVRGLAACVARTTAQCTSQVANCALLEHCATRRWESTLLLFTATKSSSDKGSLVMGSVPISCSPGRHNKHQVCTFALPDQEHGNSKALPHPTGVRKREDCDTSSEAHTCTCFSMSLFSKSRPLVLLITGSSGTEPETAGEQAT